MFFYQLFKFYSSPEGFTYSRIHLKLDYLKADAMGALVDPSRFTSKNHIEQKNLTPRVKRSEAADTKNAVPPPPESRTPKVIVAPAIKRATNDYSEV